MLRRILSLTILGLSLALNLVPSAVSAAESAADELSLYKRIGGYDVIAASVDNFLERYDNDPKLVPFIGGLNAAESARIRQHFVDYICARTGGPCLYLGRDMTQTHEGLVITDALFDRVMEHLDSALDHVGVEEAEKRELLSIMAALRSQIVTG